jgi:predicted dehydrogenase
VTSQGHIAVFGCGSWGSNIVRCLRELGCLRAVADPTPAGRARAQELAPGVQVHERIEPVLADPDVAGVMIASPAATHFDLARAALDAGKDVFVEKPMTVDLDDAHVLVEQADAADRILMVGHLLEYHPAILRLQELVLSGELGEIRYLISNRLNLGKIRTEENALWSFAPHDISVILRLVGSMPVQVVATGGCYLRPDIADVTVSQLLFADGVRSHIFVSWLHPFKEQRLVVVGSRKMASFDDVAKKLILHDQRVDGPPEKPVPVRGDGVEVDYGSEEPLRLECRHFLDCIATRRRPRTDGANGLRVLQILHASQDSLTADGRPVLMEEQPLRRPPVPEVEVARVTTTVHAPVRSSTAP